MVPVGGRDVVLLYLKDLWALLERLRAGPEIRSRLVPVCPELIAGVKFFRRYRTGWVLDGYCRSTEPARHRHGLSICVISR